jgi:hypothetical protein
LDIIRDGWRRYQRNELLAIAVQGIFWTGLDSLSTQHWMPEHSDAYRTWFVETFSDEPFPFRLDDTFGQMLARIDQYLPDFGLWEDPLHEIQLGWQLEDINRHFDRVTCHEDVLKASLTILSALAVREHDDLNPYGVYITSLDYLGPYPINLHSFSRHIRETWPSLTIREWLGWLATKWGIETHFTIALRKLRYQRQDTFRIKPTDQGLKVIDVPFPTFSNPRLNQALQILCDTGVIDMSDENIRLSKYGETLLETYRA